jgi:hypothetical protein
LESPPTGDGHFAFDLEDAGEDLAEDFMKDPIGSERDFGARPPGAENPFIFDTNTPYVWNVDSWLDRHNIAHAKGGQIRRRKT